MQRLAFMIWSQGRQLRRAGLAKKVILSQNISRIANIMLKTQADNAKVLHVSNVEGNDGHIISVCALVADDNKGSMCFVTVSASDDTPFGKHLCKLQKGMDAHFSLSWMEPDNG